MPCAEECAGQVDVECFTPCLHRNVRNRHGISGRADIVESDIEPAKVIDRCLHQSTGKLFVSYVTGHSDRFAAGIFDLGDESGQLAFLARVTTTFAPSFAKSLAASYPIPELAPVMMATFFDNCPMVETLRSLDCG